jgi:hypothetical protein
MRSLAEPGGAVEENLAGIRTLGTLDGIAIGSSVVAPTKKAPFHIVPRKRMKMTLAHLLQQPERRKGP